MPSGRVCGGGMIAVTTLGHTGSNYVRNKFMNVNVIFGGGLGLSEGTVSVFGCEDLIKVRAVNQTEI
jgi:hypothetical protein